MGQIAQTRHEMGKQTGEDGGTRTDLPLQEIRIGRSHVCTERFENRQVRRHSLGLKCSASQDCCVAFLPLLRDPVQKARPPDPRLSRQHHDPGDPGKRVFELLRQRAALLRPPDNRRPWARGM
jgi:hypothetical protein